MKVREAMARTITSAHPDSTVLDVAEIMRREDSGFVPVIEVQPAARRLSAQGGCLRQLSAEHSVAG